MKNTHEELMYKALLVRVGNVVREEGVTVRGGVCVVGVGQGYKWVQRRSVLRRRRKRSGGGQDLHFCIYDTPLGECKRGDGENGTGTEQLVSYWI